MEGGVRKDHGVSHMNTIQKSIINLFKRNDRVAAINDDSINLNIEDSNVDLALRQKKPSRSVFMPNEIKNRVRNFTNNNKNGIGYLYDPETKIICIGNWEKNIYIKQDNLDEIYVYNKKNKKIEEQENADRPKERVNEHVYNNFDIREKMFLEDKIMYEDKKNLEFSYLIKTNAYNIIINDTSYEWKYIGETIDNTIDNTFKINGYGKLEFLLYIFYGNLEFDNNADKIKFNEGILIMKKDKTRPDNYPFWFDLRGIWNTDNPSIDKSTDIITTSISKKPVATVTSKKPTNIPTKNLAEIIDNVNPAHNTDTNNYLRIKENTEFNYKIYFDSSEEEKEKYVMPKIFSYFNKKKKMDDNEEMMDDNEEKEDDNEEKEDDNEEKENLLCVIFIGKITEYKDKTCVFEGKYTYIEKEINTMDKYDIYRIVLFEGTGTFDIKYKKLNSSNKFCFYHNFKKTIGKYVEYYKKDEKMKAYYAIKIFDKDRDRDQDYTIRYYHYEDGKVYYDNWITHERIYSDFPVLDKRSLAVDGGNEANFYMYLYRIIKHKENDIFIVNMGLGLRFKRINKETYKQIETIKFEFIDVQIGLYDLYTLGEKIEYNYDNHKKSTIDGVWDNTGDFKGSIYFYDFYDFKLCRNIVFENNQYIFLPDNIKIEIVDNNQYYNGIFKDIIFTGKIIPKKKNYYNEIEYIEYEEGNYKIDDRLYYKDNRGSLYKKDTDITIHYKDKGILKGNFKYGLKDGNIMFKYPIEINDKSKVFSFPSNPDNYCIININYKDDKRNGIINIEYPSQFRIEGNYKDDKKHGEFSYKNNINTETKKNMDEIITDMKKYIIDYDFGIIIKEYFDKKEKKNDDTENKQTDAKKNDVKNTSCLVKNNFLDFDHTFTFDSIFDKDQINLNIYLYTKFYENGYTIYELYLNGKSIMYYLKVDNKIISFNSIFMEISNETRCMLINSIVTYDSYIVKKPENFNILEKINLNGHYIHYSYFKTDSVKTFYLEFLYLNYGIKNRSDHNKNYYMNKTWQYVSNYINIDDDVIAQLNDLNRLYIKCKAFNYYGDILYIFKTNVYKQFLYNPSENTSQIEIINKENKLENIDKNVDDNTKMLTEEVNGNRNIKLWIDNNAPKGNPYKCECHADFNDNQNESNIVYDFKYIESRFFYKTNNDKKSKSIYKQTLYEILYGGSIITNTNYNIIFNNITSSNLITFRFFKYVNKNISVIEMIFEKYSENIYIKKNDLLELLKQTNEKVYNENDKYKKEKENFDLKKVTSTLENDILDMIPLKFKYNSSYTPINAHEENWINIPEIIKSKFEDNKTLFNYNYLKTMPDEIFKNLYLEYPEFCALLNIVYNKDELIIIKSNEYVTNFSIEIKELIDINDNIYKISDEEKTVAINLSNSSMYEGKNNYEVNDFRNIVLNETNKTVINKILYYYSEIIKKYNENKNKNNSKYNFVDMKREQIQLSDMLYETLGNYDGKFGTDSKKKVFIIDNNKAYYGNHIYSYVPDNIGAIFKNNIKLEDTYNIIDKEDGIPLIPIYQDKENKIEITDDFTETTTDENKITKNELYLLRLLHKIFPNNEDPFNYIDNSMFREILKLFRDFNNRIFVYKNKFMFFDTDDENSKYTKDGVDTKTGKMMDTKNCAICEDVRSNGRFLYLINHPKKGKQTQTQIHPEFLCRKCYYDILFNPITNFASCPLCRATFSKSYFQKYLEYDIEKDSKDLFLISKYKGEDKITIKPNFNDKIFFKKIKLINYLISTNKI